MFTLEGGALRITCSREGRFYSASFTRKEYRLPKKGVSKFRGLSGVLEYFGENCTSVSSEKLQVELSQS